MMRLFSALCIVVVSSAGCSDGTTEWTTAPEIGSTESSESNSFLAEGEKDLVREQVEDNFVLDAGMSGLESFIVIVVVDMKPDGTVVSARVDPSTQNSNPNWQLFAESCRRAVLRSSPLRMPVSKPYEAWKQMKFRFSGRELRGR